MGTSTIGYLRVSTAHQDLEKNRADILTFANERKLGNVEWVEETVSGKVSWRKRALCQVIERLAIGDALVVPELSRLGRSMLEIMEILSIATQKGIHVYAVKGAWQLGSGIQSKIVAMAFAMAAEIERDLISQRTTEALRVKKAAGVKLGRPKGPGKSKLDQYAVEIRALLSNGSSQRFIAKRYHVSPTTLFSWIRKHGIEILKK